MTEGASNLLSNLSVKNVNTLIIGNLDINLISSKLDKLNLFAQRRVDKNQIGLDFSHFSVYDGLLH